MFRFYRATCAILATISGGGFAVAQIPGTLPPVPACESNTTKILLGDAIDAAYIHSVIRFRFVDWSNVRQVGERSLPAPQRTCSAMVNLRHSEQNLTFRVGYTRSNQVAVFLN